MNSIKYLGKDCLFLVELDHEKFYAKAGCQICDGAGYTEEPGGYRTGRTYKRQCPLCHAYYLVAFGKPEDQDRLVFLWQRAWRMIAESWQEKVKLWYNGYMNHREQEAREAGTGSKPSIGSTVNAFWSDEEHQGMVKAALHAVAMLWSPPMIEGRETT